MFLRNCSTRNGKTETLFCTSASYVISNLQCAVKPYLSILSRPCEMLKKMPFLKVGKKSLVYNANSITGRYTEIERENRILLEKMSNIM